jgi:hypothetical protein
LPKRAKRCTSILSELAQPLQNVIAMVVAQAAGRPEKKRLGWRRKHPKTVPPATEGARWRSAHLSCEAQPRRRRMRTDIRHFAASQRATRLFVQ